LPWSYPQLVGDAIVIHNIYSNTVEARLGAGANHVGSTSSARRGCQATHRRAGGSIITPAGAACSRTVDSMIVYMMQVLLCALAARHAPFADEWRGETAGHHAA
jgi:hypothetical protein